MKKTNVLVFPCGSEIGLEVFRSAAYALHFNLIGGSSVDDHGKFVYKNYISDIPLVDDPRFIEKINSIIKKHDIDFIIPAHDSVVLKLAQEKAAGNLECKIITSDIQTCEITRSKLKTYTHFKDKLATPKIYNQESLTENDLPVFLKPDVGQGSKGTRLATSIEDVKFYTAKDPSLLLLEYLPGKEFTIDCLTNKDGELLFAEGRERVRTSGGISVNTHSVDNEKFKMLASAINQNLKLRGVWFFQVKENAAGELVLMEIAPRVAGTMALVRAKGVNLVLLSLFDALGQDVSIFYNSYHIVLDRALGNTYQHDITYQHVYLDFDDLVVVEDKVNPTVMAFVYQCLNNDIKVHLITSHRGDLEKTLKKYRLDSIFDELIWAQDGSQKHTYIKEKNAIFIDDSFAERKRVHDECGIPVFDSHMIEALMEKF